MLFDKLCRYIAYGWGSVETQQIPAILEVGGSTTCRPDHEVHAPGSVPDIVFIIECRFIRTDLTSGTFRVWSWGTPGCRRRNRTSIGRSTPCRRWGSTRSGSIWTRNQGPRWIDPGCGRSPGTPGPAT